MKRGRKKRTAKYIQPLLLQERYEEAVQAIINYGITEEAIILVVTKFDDSKVALLAPIMKEILACEMDEEYNIYPPYFKERLESFKNLLRQHAISTTD